MKETVQKFMNALMDSWDQGTFEDFLEEHGLNEYDYQEVQDWFKFRNIDI